MQNIYIFCIEQNNTSIYEYCIGSLQTDKRENIATTTVLKEILFKITYKNGIYS